MDIKKVLFRTFFPHEYASLAESGSQAYVMRETFIDEAYYFLTQGLKPNTVVIDIGANIGDTAIYLAHNQKVKKVIAYEPYNNLYLKARENIKASRVGSKIELRRAAVSDRDSIISIPDDVIGLGNSPLKKYARGTRIRQYGLDTILDGIRASPVVIKCDAEGSEHSIMRRDLNLMKVYLMQIEWHETVGEIPKLLRSQGFKYKISESGPKNTLNGGRLGYICAWRA